MRLYFDAAVCDGTERAAVGLQDMRETPKAQRDRAEEDAKNLRDRLMEKMRPQLGEPPLRRRSPRTP
jgi:hypothetical protein